VEAYAVLARELARHGGGVMFGVTGESNVFMADQFVRAEGGRYVAAASEAGAVAMAKGYAAITGGPGIATVTHGPGLTNTLTALVDGVREETALVLVAGDTAVTDSGNLQNIDQRQVVLAAGAGLEQVRSPETICDDTAAAFRRALTERRPVVLNVPADFMFARCDAAPVTLRAAEPAPGPADGPVDEAVAVIASARRPIVLAGRGAVAPGARAALLALAARAGAPVATTLKAKDLFRGEDADLGIFGTLSSPDTVTAIAASDCIVAFGASLNGWTTARGAYLDGKRVVQCDLDARRLGARARIDAGVAGDAAAVAGAIARRLDEADLPPAAFRSVLSRREPVRAADNDDGGARHGDRPSGLGECLDALDAAAPADRIVVLDSGRFVFAAFSRLHAADPAWFVPTVGFGAIGLGMGHAAGAACAGSGRPVLLVSGDGGFMLGGLAEFSTAVRYGLDVIVAICNDGSYGAEEAFMRERGADPAIARFSWPDFAAVATSLGGQGVTIATAAGLADLAAIIAARTRPLLLDIQLDPDTIDGFEH
jgi:acetolactate synthase I/II/III large subunit